MAFHRFCRALLAGEPITGLRRRPAVARLHLRRRRGRGQPARVAERGAAGRLQRRRRLAGRGAARRSRMLERALGRRGAACASSRGRPAIRCARAPTPRGCAPTSGFAPRVADRATGCAAEAEWARARSYARPRRDEPTPPELSVVVPACNEAESLPELHRELARGARRASGGPWEILYVDDGSRDGTDAGASRELAAADPRVRGVVVPRATSASRRRWPSGFRLARGELRRDARRRPAGRPGRAAGA